MRRAVALLLCVEAGCVFNPSIPAGAIITCHASDECPSGYRCELSLQRCFEIDADTSTVSLVIESVTLNRTLVGPDREIQLDFELSGRTAAPPAVRLAWLGGMEVAMTAQTLSGATETAHRFVYRTRGSEPQGFVSLLFDWTALSGIPGNAELPHMIELDFTPPRIIPDTTSLRYTAPEGHPLRDVLGATVATRVSVSFAISEPLIANPTLASVSNGFTLLSAVGTAYAFELELAPSTSYPQGTQTLVASFEDLAGNVATETLAASYFVDTLPPEPVNTGEAGLVIYTREPYGTPASAGVPDFRVQGGSGAVAACAADEPMPCRTLIAYDGPDPATASEIGRIEAAADGAFGPLALLRADRPRIYLAVADAAGNLSTMAGVHDIEWRLAFGIGAEQDGHVIDRLYEASNVALGSLESPIDNVEYQALELIDGQGAEAWATPYWRERFASDSLPIVPLGRKEAAMAADDMSGDILLFGGMAGGDSSGYGAVANDETWLLRAGRWRELYPEARLPTRVGAVMFRDDGEGAFVLFGGSSTQPCNSAPPPADPNVCDETWSFDGVRWRKLDMPTRPPARYGAAKGYDPVRQRVVLFGGRDAHDDLLDDVWEWGRFGTPTCASETQACWRQILPSPGPEAREDAAMAFDPSLGWLVLFGGRTGADDHDDLWGWTGTEWEPITPPGPMPEARSGHVMGYDPWRDKILLYGGLCGVVGCANAAWEWGSHGAATCGADGVRCFRFIPNASSRVWSSIARDAMTGDLVVFGGNNPSSGENVSDTSIYDGSSLRAVPIDEEPGNYTGAVGAYDATRKRMLLFGGWDPVKDEPTGSTFFWDGIAWSEVSPPTGPTGRMYASASLHVSRTYIVLFGGETTNGDPCIAASTRCDDTYEWGMFATCSPVSAPCWRAANATTKPMRRSRHATAYDPLREYVLMFGGSSDLTSAPCTGSVCGDTWGFRAWGIATCGGTFVPCWKQLTDGSTFPSARYQHAMATDFARQRIVLYGGQLVAGNCAGSGNKRCTDTWEWGDWGDCGSAGVSCWKQRAPSHSPGPRSGHAMVYDEERGRVLLIGGKDADDVERSDTWEWDGNDWTEHTVLQTANVASEWPAVYDPNRRVVMTSYRHSPPVGDSLYWRLVELSSASLGRPALRLTVDWARAGAEHPEISDIDLSVSAGGIAGDAAPYTAAHAGVDLAAWSRRTSQWETVALSGNTLPMSASAPPLLYSANSSSDIRDLLIGERMLFRLSAKTPYSGPFGRPKIGLDAATVTVRYREP